MAETAVDTGWIGVDLDGTLAKYNHWKGFEHIGEPVPEMVARVKKWLKEGRRVKVMTARISGLVGRPELRQAVTRFIQDWCREHIGSSLEVTCEKDFEMLELYDDRAVQVEFNTGKVVGYSTRGSLHTNT